MEAIVGPAGWSHRLIEEFRFLRMSACDRIAKQKVPSGTHSRDSSSEAHVILRTGEPVRLLRGVQ